MTPDFSNKKLIVISGPTATGKSKVAVELAKFLPGEVISADSIQVYRGMDIGSAKIRKDEMRGIVHHLIDVIDIDIDYNAYMFQSMAKEAMSGIYERGKVPIVCGGTGFYIQALIYDIQFEKLSNKDPDTFTQADLKIKLEEKLKNNGLEALSQELKAKDPYGYEGIDLKNPKKVIRALEFYELYGYSFRRHNEKEARKREKSPYDLKFFVLYMDRNALYSRIDERVDLMMKEGLLDEVKALVDQGLSLDSTPGKAIGYKELILALSGKISLEEAVKKIKLNTRHFAKRQLSWYRREKNAHWIDIEKVDAISEIRKYL